LLISVFSAGPFNKQTEFLKKVVKIKM